VVKAKVLVVERVASACKHGKARLVIDMIMAMGMVTFALF